MEEQSTAEQLTQAFDSRPRQGGARETAAASRRALGTNSVVALVDGLFSSGRSTISSLRHFVRGLMARIWCSLNYARMAGVKACAAY